MLSKYVDLYRMIRQACPPLWPFGLAIALTFLETGLSLWVPLLTRDLIDTMGADFLSNGTLWLLVAVMVVDGLAGGAAVYALGFTGQSVVANLRLRLFGHVIGLPVAFFDKSQSGELVSRMVSDVEALEDLIAQHLVSFLSGVVMIFGSIVILYVLDAQMTLVLFSAVIIALIIIIPIALVMYRISKNLQDETASFTARVTQVLANIRLVKAATAETQERSQGASSINKLFSLGLKEISVHAVLGPLMTVSITAALIIILGYGGSRVQAGDLQIGSLVAFILYLFNIVIPMLQLTYFMTALQKALGASERIGELLKSPVEPDQGTESIANFDRPLIFKDVHFGYSSEAPLLQGLNFSLEPGGVTALVGPSGGGKTTIMSLLERFYPPTAGDIQLGDQSINHFSLREWRQKVGYVSQNAPMLAGTIRENIIYGLAGDVTEENLQAATKAAQAYDFVTALPQGFDTEVGEQGVTLSGGQRQRLAIARAILRDPQLLLLDEATSNLDSDSEQAVQLALEALSRDKTTFVIAHRLATVMKADHILVLEEGCLSARGTHAQLLATHPPYQRWVQQQAHVSIETTVSPTHETAS